MTVYPPYEKRPAIHRVRTATSWQGNATAWVTLPMQKPRGSGIRVRKYGRRCLPQIGTAVLSYEYGVIDGVAYGPDDLGIGKHHEIRIERDVSADGSGTWVTVWWGEVVALRRLPAPGATTPQGTLEYHCRDALHRLSRWKMNRHTFSTATRNYGGDELFSRGCYGHPGYNRRNGLSVVGNAFNADPLGVGYTAHTWAGSQAASTWTDAEAIEHALHSSMPVDKIGPNLHDLGPRFTLAGSLDSLDTENFWPVDTQMDCLRFITQVLDRRRGRGNSYLDWTESGDVLTPLIRVLPSSIEDLSQVLPGGGNFSVDGAETAGRAIDVDLVGDHRLLDDRFEISEPFDMQYDGVEIIGDPIRVLVTMSVADNSLEESWEQSLESDYNSISEDAAEGASAKFADVFRTLRIPLSWDLKVANGGGTTFATSCDYAVDGDGEIFLRSNTNPASSVGLVRIDDDLPILAGYNYTNAPAPFAGSAGAEPKALPIQVYEKTTSTPRFQNLRALEQLSVQRGGPDGQSLTFSTSNDIGRFFEARYQDTIAVTVGLTMPTPLRMERIREGAAGFDPARSMKTITAKGMALHLAHPEAIWSLDEDSEAEGVNGYLPLRNAANPSGTYGILRDDRDRMAIRLALAGQWYLRDRHTATWALHECGTAGTWTDANGDEQTWPGIGDVINTMSYDGDTVLIDGPITGIDYDDDEGTTTWIAGFADLDWSEG